MFDDRLFSTTCLQSDGCSLWVYDLEGASLFERVDAGRLNYPVWPKELGEQPRWFSFDVLDLTEMVQEAERLESRNDYEEYRRQVLGDYLTLCVGSPR